MGTPGKLRITQLDAHSAVSKIWQSSLLVSIEAKRCHVLLPRHQWPVIMANTMEACIAHGAPLIFLDNVCAYGPVAAPMTESTPIATELKRVRERAR
jgi:hypothetical protein